jgi:HPt (histidine-containing phosphotransfer) domain-containing protein
MACEKRRIPIIAMTANALPSDCERCLAAGMDDYIAKPVHQRILVDMIEKWGAIGFGGAPIESSPASPSEAGSKTTDVDLLDVDGIKEMVEVLDLPAYRDLTMQFFDSHGATAIELNAAAASGDFRQVDRLAHSLKGAASNLGLAALADQAAALRSDGHLRDGSSGVPDLMERLNAIEAVAAASRRQLLALLDTMPAEWEDAAL